MYIFKSNHPDVILSDKTKLTLPCVDIAKFISDRYNAEDMIIVKMDIEGAEYELLIHLIKTNVLELIDYFFLEFHTNVNKIKSVEEFAKAILVSKNVKYIKWD